MKNDSLQFSQIYVLSNQEKKTIFNALSQDYPKDEVNALKETSTKLTSKRQTSNKMRIIFNDANPILIEISKNFFIPSVYAVNQLPGLVCKHAVINANTLDFLLNGADLMAKGVFNIKHLVQNGFKVGDIIAIFVEGQGVVAIGETLCFSSTLESNISGKLCCIHNIIGDGIFESGSGSFNLLSTTEELPEEKTEAPQEIKEESSLSVEELDSNLTAVFLTSLLISSDGFPLEPGKFLKEVMMSVSRQTATEIDIKKSSYKKLSNYLKTMSKAGLIEFGKVKGYEHEMISSFDSNHKYLIDFKPLCKEIKVEKIENKYSVFFDERENFRMEQRYKPLDKLVELFKKVLSDDL